MYGLDHECVFDSCRTSGQLVGVFSPAWILLAICGLFQEPPS